MKRRLKSLSLLAAVLLLSVFVGSLALWAFPGGLSSMGNGVAFALNYIAGLGISISGSTISTSGVPTGMFNVKDYGAKGDGQYVLDGSMASGLATFTFSGSTQYSNITVSLRGASGVDVHGSDHGTSTSIVSPSVTTTHANDLLLTYYGYFASPLGTLTGPAGFTEQNQSIGLSGTFRVGAFTKSIASSGPTGTATAITTGTSPSTTSVSIAITPSTTISVVGTANSATSGAPGNLVLIYDPNNTITGDLEIACITWNFVGGATLTAPDGTWTLLETATNVNTKTSCFSHIAAPTGNILTSATANFAAGDANKLICVKGVFDGGTENCGTILSDTDATTVKLSISNQTAATVSDTTVKWATDDTAAFLAAKAAMAAASPPGGIFFMPPGNYGLSAGLIFSNMAVILQGSGAMSDTWAYDQTLTPKINAVFTGTELSFLTRSMATPALQLIWTTTAHPAQAANLVEAKLLDFGLWGGVGLDYKGVGGSTAEDCININNWSGVTVDNVREANCSGNGISVSSVGGDYSDLPIIRGGFFQNNGNDGLLLNTNFPAGIKVEGNQFDENKKYGIEVAGGGTGIVISNNIIQDDNQTGTNPGYDLAITGSAAAFGVVEGNYFEQVFSPNTTSFNISTLWVGTKFLNNYINGASVFVAYHGTIGAGGTGLPTCADPYSHLDPVCVSDAAECTSGTTYVGGGGSVHCLVQCDKTNWIETGTGCF